MKIADLEGKLPARVKITQGFTSEESIDPGFVVDIIRFKEEPWGETDNKCYQVWFTIPPELIPLCSKVAISDWLDDFGNPTWNYFEAKAKRNKNGTFQDSTFVMENDDWFEFYEEPLLQFVKVKVLQDESSHWYIIPENLWGEWEMLIKANGKTVSYSDEWYSLFDDFEVKFGKYRIGGCINNYQLYISEDELKRLTGEL